MVAMLLSFFPVTLHHITTQQYDCDVWGHTTARAARSVYVDGGDDAVESTTPHYITAQQYDGDVWGRKRAPPAGSVCGQWRCCYMPFT